MSSARSGQRWEQGKSPALLGARFLAVFEAVKTRARLAGLEAVVAGAENLFCL